MSQKNKNARDVSERLSFDEGIRPSLDLLGQVIKMGNTNVLSRLVLEQAVTVDGNKDQSDEAQYQQWQRGNYQLRVIVGDFVKIEHRTRALLACNCNVVAMYHGTEPVTKPTNLGEGLCA